MQKLDIQWLNLLKESLPLNEKIENPICLDIYAYDEISSTMDIYENPELKNLAHRLDCPLNITNEVFSSNPESFLCRYQTQGKGRNDRIWVSGRDKGIYLTIAFDLKFHSTNFSGYSLAMGVTVVKTLAELGFQLLLKWPNDIYSHDSHKIGGILVETKSSSNYINKLIVGLGLNIYKQDFPPALNAKSLDDLKHRNMRLDYFQLLSHLQRRIVLDTQNFIKNGFTYFKDDWNRYSIINGKTVSLVPQGEEVIAVGAEDDGGLIIMQNDIQRVLHQGEVSIKI